MRHLENPILRVARQHWQLTGDPNKDSLVKNSQVRKHVFTIMEVGITILGDTYQAGHSVGEQKRSLCLKRIFFLEANVSYN